MLEMWLELNLMVISRECNRYRMQEDCALPAALNRQHTRDHWLRWWRQGTCKASANKNRVAGRQPQGCTQHCNGQPQASHLPVIQPWRYSSWHTRALQTCRPLLHMPSENFFEYAERGYQENHLKTGDKCAHIYHAKNERKQHGEAMQEHISLAYDCMKENRIANALSP